jgi:hypothetical protein
MVPAEDEREREAGAEDGAGRVPAKVATEGRPRRLGHAG